MVEQKQPVAFMSYVRLDDEHEEGRLTLFRERLSGEVQMQTGEQFPIFQDRNDIKWGENWKRRIEDGLDASAFLIPIITPSFFNSPACRAELTRFLERELALGRDDLVLPVYYVDCPLLNDSVQREKDELAIAVAAHQWADWREFRFEPLTAPEVGRRLAALGQQVRDAIQTRIPDGSIETVNTGQNNGKSAVEARTSELAESTEEEQGAAEVAAKTEPTTWVVDPMNRGQFLSIGEAIAVASPGDRVLVREGLYLEPIVIDKPLELIGDGERDDIIVRIDSASVLTFKASMGRVSNMTLRQAAGEAERYCVDILQGRLQLEECDISSESLAGICIRRDADPRIRRSLIHDCKRSGIVVVGGGLGTIEDNEVFANALSGLTISSGGNPNVRRNRIHGCAQNGVYCHTGGQGILEDNEIFACGYAGISVASNANPVARRNDIHSCRQNGIFVHEDGLGVFEDNDVHSTTRAGVLISTGGNPTLRLNRIYECKESGVFVREGGKGTLENNEIARNGHAGIRSSGGGPLTAFENQIHENNYEAVWLTSGGGGDFKYNDLRGNGLKGAWDIAADSVDKVTQTDNLEDELGVALGNPQPSPGG